MNTSFTKLFSSIVTSTIWREDDKVRIIWVTLLAIADQHGEVNASIPGLAAIANVSVDECESALDKLASPDPYSRTRDHEGRRIEAIEGGWRLLNYQKYRQIGQSLTRREYLREKQREHRERQRRTSTRVNTCQHPSTTRTHANGKQKQKQKKGGGAFAPPTAAEVDEYAKQIGYHRPNLGRDFVQRYEATGWRLKDGKPMSNWKLSVQTWRRLDEQNPNRAPSEETAAPLVRGPDGRTPREVALAEMEDG